MPPIFYPTLPEFQFGKAMYAEPYVSGKTQQKIGSLIEKREAINKRPVTSTPPVAGQTAEQSAAKNLSKGPTNPMGQEPYKAEYSEGESGGLTFKGPNFNGMHTAENATHSYGIAHLGKIKGEPTYHLYVSKKGDMSQSHFHGRYPSAEQAKLAAIHHATTASQGDSK